MKISARTLAIIAMIGLVAVPEIASATPGPCNSFSCLIGLLRNGPHGAKTCVDAVQDFIYRPDNRPWEVCGGPSTLEDQKNARRNYLRTCHGSEKVMPEINEIIEAYGPNCDPPPF
jgi:hypothetical protein